jgi:hypothetical protein
VIKALDYLHRKHLRREVIRRALGYFRATGTACSTAGCNAPRLRRRRAASKTLVTQRLKLSGRYWSPAGAQGILTMRAWDQSERFHHAWALLVAKYKSEVCHQDLRPPSNSITWSQVCGSYDSRGGK